MMGIVMNGIFVVHEPRNRAQILGEFWLWGTAGWRSTMIQMSMLQLGMPLHCPFVEPSMAYRTYPRFPCSV